MKVGFELRLALKNIHSLGAIHLWCSQENVFDPFPVHMRPHETDPSPLWTSTCYW